MSTKPVASATSDSKKEKEKTKETSAQKAKEDSADNGNDDDDDENDENDDGEEDDSHVDDDDVSGKDEKKDKDKDKEKDTKADLSDANVVTKYRAAGDIVNDVLQRCMKAAKVGIRIVEVCQLGDKLIEEATAKIYKDKKVEKGVAFPTCVSVNHVVGHCAPLTADTVQLKAGDLVKVDLGVHIDGYVVVGAHSFVLTEDGPASAASKSPVSGRAADAILAAATAADLSLRLLKPGNKNHSVTEMMAKVADEYKVTPVAGVLSHAMARWLIDGEKVIISKVDLENKVEEYKFEVGEVWTIDMVMSTGEGKPRESSERTTIFKRQKGAVYQLKRQAARALLSEVDRKFADFPFHLRQVTSADSSESKTLFGMKELFEHQLVQAYPVLFEKDGEVVAHVKCTVLITPSGPLRISGLPYDVIVAGYQSENKLKDADLLKLKSSSIKFAAEGAPKKDNKKKKNKKKKDKKKDANTANQTTASASASSSSSVAASAVEPSQPSA